MLLHSQQRCFPCFRNSVALGKTICHWNHGRAFFQQKTNRALPAHQPLSPSRFTESESRTTGHISEDRWQRQDTGEGVWGEADPSRMHHRGPSVRSGNRSAEMPYLQGRNTRTLEVQKWEKQIEGQRTGEGRKETEDGAGAGQSSGAWGWTGSGRFPHPLHRCPLSAPAGLVLLQCHLLAGQGLSSSSSFFNFLLVVCLLHLTLKQ